MTETTVTEIFHSYELPKGDYTIYEEGAYQALRDKPDVVYCFTHLFPKFYKEYYLPANGEGG